MNARTIVILGAGIGGIVTANLLRKTLPRAHRVVLVEREERHIFLPSLLWLMTGQRTPEQISQPLDTLRKQGIELIRGNIEHIDPQRRMVKVNGIELTGDYLVIALGAELAPETIPGLAQATDILLTLVRDTETRVRRSIAEHLKDSLSVPRELVMRIPREFEGPGSPRSRFLLFDSTQPQAR